MNVRSTPENKGDDNVIGKLTSKAAGDIIETLDGWYKIKSGTVTGYIAADPELIATGQEQKIWQCKMLPRWLLSQRMY